ncbi:MULTISPECIES: cupin domain-containing protein [Photobacterium]|uniref:cupin domain-containing protein n=1 Tax=Photobacterium TaxID=657 RepID=UPI002E175E9C|nr:MULTISPECIES: cupin domain-containing protein [Photobacterium]MEC6797257.1 cupin domain-containing protein [Photobacterium sp. S4TG1]MEC6908112.1 cupin domain-containing protein [Photobacterium piscicola]
MNTFISKDIWSDFTADPEFPGFSFRDTDESNTNCVTALLERWEAGTVEDAHHHPHDDMSIIVTGEIAIQFHLRVDGELVNDGEPMILKAGQTGYIKANRIHSVVYTTDCDMVYIQNKTFGFETDK